MVASPSSGQRLQFEVVRSLTDSAAMERVAALLDAGVAPDRTRSLRRLRGIASLLTRVQNAFLYDWYSVTLALLRRFGEEQRVFAAFSDQHQEARRSELPAGERVDAFERWYAAYVAQREGASWRWLEDAFAHERAVRRLILAASVPPARGAGSAGTVPCPLRPMRGVRLFHDAAAVATALTVEHAAFPAARRAQPYLYVVSAPGTLRTFAVDELTFVVLDLVDGRRSVAEIAALAAVAIGDATPDDVRELIDAFAEQSIVLLT